jgi:excisionase family DNA binding protein
VALSRYRRRRQLWEQSLAQETYSVAEAAEMTNMSERRVRRLINDGELYAEKLSSRNTLIPKQAIVDLMVPPLSKKFWNS